MWHLSSPGLVTLERMSKIAFRLRGAGAVFLFAVVFELICVLVLENSSCILVVFSALEACEPV